MASTLDSIAQEGLITAEQRQPVEKQLRELLVHPKIADWFSRSWDVRTEVPILVPDAPESRIDRLLTRDRIAVVIDFKTGARNKTDEKQVLEYMEILRRMNFIQVEGYLVYLAGNEIAEVKAGGKPKLLQRTKNRDQLDLGF
jgi:hypothetical protein